MTYIPFISIDIATIKFDKSRSVQYQVSVLLPS
jgi:hypothetical protein